MKIYRIHHSFRVALISLDWIRPKDPKLPLGHASLIANVIQENHLDHRLKLKTYEFDVRKSFQIGDEKYFDQFCLRVSNKVLSFQPDLIALGAFVWNESHIQKIIWILRDKMKFKGKILLGGPQVTYAPTGTLERFYPKVDFFIRGYGEISLYQLIRNFLDNNFKKLVEIPGVHIAGTVDLGLQSERSRDLQSLRSPYLDNIIDVERNFIRWESQRGCPFSCSFCQHKDKYSQRQGFCERRIQQEIELFCDKKRSNVNDIAVLDPTFNSGKNYLAIMDLFSKNGF